MHFSCGVASFFLGGGVTILMYCFQPDNNNKVTVIGRAFLSVCISGCVLCQESVDESDASGASAAVKWRG